MMCETSMLENGIRVITRSRHGFHGAAVGIWLVNGVRHQRADQNGFAHLLEHLLFRGRGVREGDTLAERFESLCGYLNAETGRELTALHGVVPGERAVELLDLLIALLLGPRFDHAEFDGERAIVLREMEVIAAAPEQAIEETALQLAWPDDALGWPILGRREVLEGATCGELLDYLKASLSAARVWVVANGAVKHEAITRACAPLAALPNSPFPVLARPVFRKGRYRERRHTANTHLLWALPVAAPRSSDYPALLMGTYILGGGTASRLFRELRTRLGLVYEVHARLEFLSDGGLLFVQSSCAPSDSLQCQRAVERVIARFLKDGPEAQELERARSHLLAGLLLEEDDLELSMQRLAREAIYLGRHPGSEEYATMVNSVAAHDVGIALSSAWESHLALVWDPIEPGHRH